MLHGAFKAVTIGSRSASTGCYTTRTCNGYSTTSRIRISMAYVGAGSFTAATTFRPVSVTGTSPPLGHGEIHHEPPPANGSCYSGRGGAAVVNDTWST